MGIFDFFELLGLNCNDFYDDFDKNDTFTVEMLIDCLIACFNKSKEEFNERIRDIRHVRVSPDVSDNSSEDIVELDLDMIIFNKNLLNKKILNSTFAGVEKVSDDYIEILYIKRFSSSNEKEKYLISLFSSLGLKYITRDEDGSLYAWQYEPVKTYDNDNNKFYWFYYDDTIGNNYKIYDNFLFPNIIWEQDEPFKL